MLNLKRSRRTSVRTRLPYYQKVKKTFGSSLLAYWPMWETSGTTVFDISGNGRNGSYVNSIALNHAPSPAKRPAAYFSAGYVNVLSAIQSVFDGNEGGISFWVRGDNFALGGGTFRFTVDNSNLYQQTITSTVNTLWHSQKANNVLANGVYKINNTGWFHVVMTWSVSSNLSRTYINGALIHNGTRAETFIGTLVGATIGYINSYWSGWISDFIVTNRLITYPEALLLATAQIRPKRIAIMGDSITNDTGPKWPDYLANLGFNQGFIGLMNHAYPGNNILNSMPVQVTSAASDNADIIIMALGTNDTTASGRQSVVETAIDNLRISNPNATIYYLNVLPRWTNNTGVTPVDKSTIRTAVAAACSAKNVTCWDTFTTPWITAAETTDGLHLTTAGSQIVSNEVLSRIT